ncbi:urease accessory protein [Blastococcus aurantiacus]|uniref:Urease accessory protein n=1 Tax=Blastococcus aurantiacus TaxID=1550231 RepID=A0A1G7MQM6_9ACTN|nr:urease accessory protein UreE [Blastococcus aurantiacus]SDF64052.1 urease accessory protein [Blastococcus aurantiacus]
MEVTAILGFVTDDAFAGRAVDPVDVPWGDARKHRQALRTAGGRDVVVRLPRGSFLADGAVLVEDGATVVVVRRPAEDAIVLPFADNTGADAVRRALLLGYLLGNQHAPLEVSATELRTPLLTGPGTARKLLEDLHLHGRVDTVALAAHGWTNTSADHHGQSATHGHHHAP